MTFELARAETVSYHNQYYSRHELFDQESWLATASTKVMEIAQQELPNIENPRVLDLGCGVGRNAIPLAKLLATRNCEVTCVDMLDIALQKLCANARKYEVARRIVAVKACFEDYPIQETYFDLLLAISVLEHSRSLNALQRVLLSMKNGTRPGGVQILDFSVDRKVSDVKTGKEIETHVETPLTKATLMVLLPDVYRDWDITFEYSSYDEILQYNGQDVRWQSSQICAVARKSQH